jgi:hypothetical protein
MRDDEVAHTDTAKQWRLLSCVRNANSIPTFVTYLNVFLN